MRRAGSVADLAAAAPREPLLWTLSPALEGQFAVLGKIALAKVSVMIRGQSGTGKEVVTSAIHALSPYTRKLQLSGWVFEISSGEVYDYDPGLGEFIPLRAP